VLNKLELSITIEKECNPNPKPKRKKKKHERAVQGSTHARGGGGIGSLEWQGRWRRSRTCRDEEQERGEDKEESASICSFLNRLVMIISRILIQLVPSTPSIRGDLN
jgi:hypothetical protein